MNIRESTRSYEAWLRKRTPVVETDLDEKHRLMGASAFVLLRATFYQWAERWPSVCRDIADAPVVLAVGDLHVENFGTWRDAEGRLVWGVNDFDEAYPLPYTNDIVRLATSAVLATRKQSFRLSAREACDAILDGYAECLDRGGRPVVLAERHRWLRRIAIDQLKQPGRFWRKLASNSPTRLPVPRAAIEALLPRGVAYRVVARSAGAGSRGRRRFVALAKWDGGRIAREAKAYLPSAVAWVRGDTSGRIHGPRLLARAVRAPDPFYRIGSDWVVRRLAPDCTKIELVDLPDLRDAERLLLAMGWETANIHVGTPTAKVLKDLLRRPRRWLERAAAAMADATVADWKQWKKR
jgi:uncharacterized protein DUF2252